jgi:hypothetical protein
MQRRPQAAFFISITKFVVARMGRALQNTSTRLTDALHFDSAGKHLSDAAAVEWPRPLRIIALSAH